MPMKMYPWRPAIIGGDVQVLKMNVIETSIPGVVIIKPKVFGDERGYIFESWSLKEFDEKARQNRFVQDNGSRSIYGILRGLLFQKSSTSKASWFE